MISALIVNYPPRPLHGPHVEAPAPAVETPRPVKQPVRKG